MGIYESPVTFRLQFVSGDDSFLGAYIEFDPTASVENHSWGVIKSLFN